MKKSDGGDSETRDGETRHVVTSPPAGVGDAQTRHLADEVRRLRAVVRECENSFHCINDDLNDFHGGCQCRAAEHDDGVYVCPFCMAVYMERKCREVLGD